MVYQFERNTWYLRDTDITPVAAYSLIDRTFAVAAADKIVDYSHSETTFDEQIVCNATIGVKDLGEPDEWKKVRLFAATAKGNRPLAMAVWDPERIDNGEAISQDGHALNADEHTTKKFRPNYWFKNLEASIGCNSASNTTSLTIRKARIDIDGKE